MEEKYTAGYGGREVGGKEMKKTGRWGRQEVKRARR